MLDRKRLLIWCAALVLTLPWAERSLWAQHSGADQSARARLALEQNAAKLTAFDGASGFGRFTLGGSGRHSDPYRTVIFQVRSLGDDGPGTLREAVQSTEPRTVVFAVSGVIRLASPIRITSPYLTIAGESAPAPGIAIVTDRFEINTHDVILRHLRIFVGDRPSNTKAQDRDGLALVGSEGRPLHNVIVDHCAIEGGIDENVSTNGVVSDVTISNSIIANSLNNSQHSKGQHGKAMLIGDNSKRITVVNSLFAHNHDRNPRVKPGASIEFVNNVVYNWGGTTGWNVFNISGSGKDTDDEAPVLAIIHGNVYVDGPDGRGDIPLLYPRSIVPGSKVFLADNIPPSAKTGKRGKAEPELPADVLVDKFPFAPTITQALPPREAFEYVLSHVGPHPANRTEHERKLIEEVRVGGGHLKDRTAAPGEKPADNAIPFPEILEQRHTLTLPAAPAEKMAQGRSAIEVWLAEITHRVESAQSPTVTK